MSEPGVGRDRGPSVRFYFDFVSPYSWIALQQAEDFAARHRIRWDFRPVVYAKLLDAAGLTGPGETEIRRRYMFADIVRCARSAGLELKGPPAHPFRSLEALRTFCLFREEPAAAALAAALADAAWGRGGDLTDIAVLERVVREVGLQADGLRDRIAAPATKNLLRELTAAALADGVFGVPSFVHDGELFWGQDRLPHLGDRLAGRQPEAVSAAAELARRPRGADRLRSPLRRQG